ncbi:kinesin-like protein KIF6 isoform X2 [Halichondria panicea]|uniref:kinesin-like protein KIF6 isoform X2 n=1 Tax=Halichondria panicea TaxID=6063 RepID=UPI00312B9449
MVKHGIKIFARIKPSNKTAGLFEVAEEESLYKLSLFIPHSEASGHVNNKKETFSFRFNKVFEQTTTQDEIFEKVAREVADNCLEGYNGTIFAYGQTGSGKTFTVTGGVERYSERGVIPRTLSYLFQQFQKSPDTMFTTHISYLEIYNDKGYDLLDPKHEASKLENLPKVTLLEDGGGTIHMKNLSMHPVTNEEESLNWLFIGDTNRIMAETPMNMASTRSHCIFTIHIMSREPGSDMLKKSKLHLVDLAGSERVGKTGVSGTLLNEAKYINLSLLCLEQVIVALSEKSRTHIPYRNSMLTSVLRDSLGGNCMTTMIATCSVENKNIHETISTCRFSQRVALVKNEATLNKELDPKLMVARLKAEIQDLKDELSLATGEQRTDEVTDEEKEKCKQLVEQFINDTSPECQLVVAGNMRMIQLYFRLLRAEILKARKDCAGVVDDGSTASPVGASSKDPNSEIQQNVVVSNTGLLGLRDLLRQRDDEISVLLKILKQEKRKTADAEASLKRSGSQQMRPSSTILDPIGPVQLEPGVHAKEQDVFVRQSQESFEWRSAMKTRLSQARQEAFDTFRKNFADMRAMDKHKKVLKTKYAEAKTLGERVNTCRLIINKLKGKTEKLRISRGVKGLTDGSATEDPDPKEEELKCSIEREKSNFKMMYGQLRDLKAEIEHVQHLHEKAKLQVQRDFEQWWDQQTAQQKGENSTSVKSAWRTPPLTSTPPMPTTLAASRDAPRHKRPSSQRKTHSTQTQQLIAAMLPINNDYENAVSGTIIKEPKMDNVLTQQRQLFDHDKIKVASQFRSVTRDSIPLTGDPKADADILAFYKARQKLIPERALQ